MHHHKHHHPHQHHNHPFFFRRPHIDFSATVGFSPWQEVSPHAAQNTENSNLSSPTPMSYEWKVLVPGIDASDIQVDVIDNTVSLEVRVENGAVKKIQSLFPEKADPDTLKAVLSKGYLILSVNKIQKEKKSIEIVVE